MTFEKFLPAVTDKTLERKKFNADLIYNSLLKETNITEENAKKIVKQAVQTIIGISSVIKTITAPMIREIVNTKLLEFGLEKERLQYTRIGFPFYDLKVLFDEPINNLNEEIIRHVTNEFINVNNIIKFLEENNKECHKSE